MKGKRITMNSWFDEQFENAEKKGEEKGRLEAILSLVKDGILTLQQASVRMGMSITKLKRESAKLNIDFDFENI